MYLVPTNFLTVLLCFSVVDKRKNLKKDKYHNQEDNLKWGWINTSGEVIIPAQFEKANQFSEGLALVQKDGKWGYINKKVRWSSLPNLKMQAISFPIELLYKKKKTDFTAISTEKANTLSRLNSEKLNPLAMAWRL